MKIPNTLKMKAKKEKAPIEMSSDQDTRATASSSGKGVAAMKPARAGSIYFLMKRGVYFSNFSIIIFIRRFLERSSNSPATEIRIALKTIKLPMKAPAKATHPASQKFCMGDSINREATEIAVVKP